MVRECNRAVYEGQVHFFPSSRNKLYFFLHSCILIYSCINTTVEIEDERRMKNLPTFHGFTYSGETSDEDDPNEAEPTIMQVNLLLNKAYLLLHV